MRLDLPQYYTGDEQLRALYAYLTRMVDKLNYALSFLDVPDESGGAAIRAEDPNHKTIRLGEKSTNAQYPSAKAVVDYAVPKTRKINGKTLENDIVLAAEDIPNAENTNNKTTGISAESTDDQYPTARAVFRYLHPDDDVKTLKVIAIGDSICRGGRNYGRGYIGEVGCAYINLGVGGATISTVVDSSGSEDTAHFLAAQNIPDQLEKFAAIAGTIGAFSPDAIIANGGRNDYSNSHCAPLGPMPTTPVTTPEEDAELDLSTYTGGLEHLFYRMTVLFPHAKRYFLITHKDKNLPVTPNVEGYTQQDMHDAAVEVCRIYGVGVIDVYADSFLDSSKQAYLTPQVNGENQKYGDLNTFDQRVKLTEQYFIDGDGTHPLALGYRTGYAPLIVQALRTIREAV